MTAARKPYRFTDDGFAALTRITGLHHQTQRPNRVENTD
jgi:hypothetical protein